VVIISAFLDLEKNISFSDNLLERMKGPQMEILRIDNCSFGTLVVNGKTYTDDLLIYPDGEITGPWWRKRGHQLSMDDMRELLDSSPEVIDERYDEKSRFENHQRPIPGND
jgi:hypothetical protein